MRATNHFVTLIILLATLAMLCPDNSDAAGEPADEVLRLADPRTGEIPPDIRARELAFARHIPSRAGSAFMEILAGAPGTNKMQGWMFRGPDNIGGRTRALAFDLSDTTNQTLLAGGVSGGMWRSVDGGASWEPTTQPDQLQSVTALAQDTRTGHRDVWYYGTGEYHGCSAARPGSPYYGDGLFKSIDGGQSWEPLASTAGSSPTEFTSNWQYVWRLATDPSNLAEDVVYAAIIGEIQRSTDGGATFSSVLGGEDNGSRRTDIVVSSTGVVYASLSSEGTISGIFRSTDGVAWANITPPGLASHHRIVMALAPSDESILYCAVAELNGTTYEGFYKYTYLSGDGSGAGGVWEDRSATVAALPGPGSSAPLEAVAGYCLDVAVHPLVPDIVLIGGVYLYRSLDGFATTSLVTRIGGSLESLHAPYQHEILFEPGSMFVGYTATSGGIHRSPDVMTGLVGWESLNNGYCTSLFNTVAIDEQLSGSVHIIGGIRDGGMGFTASSDPGWNWRGLLYGGTGGYCGIEDASGTYGTYLLGGTSGYLFRSLVNNNTGETENWSRIDPAGGGAYLDVNPFVIDPSYEGVLYMGSGNGVWRNSDFHAIPIYNNSATSINWTHLTDFPPNMFISAMDVSRTVDRALFFGTTGGLVMKIDNADTASYVAFPDILDMGSSYEYGFVSGIDIHPFSSSKALLCVSNYNVSSIFYTENGGTHWDAVEGNLGGAFGPSVRDVAIVPVDSLYAGTGFHGEVYFAATSTELYSVLSLDGDFTEWRLESPTLMGNVVVDRLASRFNDGTVVAGTHGKGVYSISLGSVASVETGVQPLVGSLNQNVPNPFNPSTTISFELSEAGYTRLAVYDLAGRQVATLVDEHLDQGPHVVNWGGKDDAGRPMAAGVYVYQLDSGSIHEARRMTLVR